MKMYLRNLCLAMGATMVIAACGDSSKAPVATVQ